MSLITIRTVSSEQLPPDNEKVGEVFSRLGYKLADAIADIVDNSLDAEASRAHIRFLRGPDGIHGVMIADNGKGMDAETLREAMRFGSRTKKSSLQLGKYGIGLKTASLSQADSVTVISRTRKGVCGMRWTKKQVKNDWMCETLSLPDVTKQFDVHLDGLENSKSGTVVIWENLEHLRVMPEHAGQRLIKEVKELRIELGIRFHRFIESGRVQISIDQYLLSETPSGISQAVTALNPFDYGSAPLAGYPLNLPVVVNGQKLTVLCHIFPAKSRNAPGYKLGGGKVAQRQGFYFYRNDRLIQAGGWNGLRADETEPHLSLARVQVELPAVLDSIFKLQVTKMGLDPAPEFLAGIQAARSADNKTFSGFIEEALKAYGRVKKVENAKFMIVPGDGVGKSAQKAIASILKEPGTGAPKRVSFRWAKLNASELFRILPGDMEIKLNTMFKKQIIEGGTNDAPVLKVALMFLLQDELQKAFMKEASETWVQKVNSALISALND